MHPRTIALLLAGAGLTLSTAACGSGTSLTTLATASIPAGTGTPKAAASASKVAATTPEVTAIIPASALPSDSSTPAGTSNASGPVPASAAPAAHVGFAAQGAYPFQVALLDLKAVDPAGKRATNDRARLSCGGSLLDRRHVLTAAHCFDDDAENPPDPQKDMKVVVGRTTLTSKQGQVRRITKVQKHPKFDGTQTIYDVAVLTLDRPVTGITPVELVPSGNTSLQQIGTLATLTGWGSPKTLKYGADGDAAISDRMKEASVPLTAGKACRAAYQGNTYASPPNLNVSLCTSTTAGIGHCTGDSGGPLFVHDGGQVVQIGIVSWALGCGDSRYPSVWTRLSNGDINAFVRKAAGSGS